jgi:hypothetical protein
LKKFDSCRFWESRQNSPFSSFSLIVGLYKGLVAALVLAEKGKVRGRTRSQGIIRTLITVSIRFDRFLIVPVLLPVRE